MPATQVITFDVAVTIRIIQGEMFRRDEERKKRGEKRDKVTERGEIKGRRMKNNEGEDMREISDLKKEKLEEDEERQTQ